MCFKLLEEYRQNQVPLTKYGNFEEIFVTQLGALNDYNFRDRTARKNLLRLDNKTGAQDLTVKGFGVQQEDPPKIPSRVIPVKSFQTNRDMEMPLSHFGKKDESGSYTLGGKNLWILKPVGLNRGQGIHVVDSVKKVKKLIKEYCIGKEYNGSPKKASTKQLQNTYGNQQVTSVLQSTTQLNQIKCNQFIIQKYIEDPMLIKGRKFDIRVWVLITHNLDCYFFKEGYIRTSSKEYNTESTGFDDEFVHLTNNAIQKNCPGYGQHEDGNQLSFSQFQEYLKIEFGKSKQFFDKEIIEKIMNITVCSL